MPAGIREGVRLSPIRVGAKEAGVLIKCPIRADLRWCIGVFIMMRVALTVWSIVILQVYPIKPDWDEPVFAFYEKVVPGGYHDGHSVSDHLLWPWYRWDTDWYLRIAVEGYDADGRGAFPPLYPALIRGLGTLLGGQYLLAALIISNIATVLVIWLIYQESYAHFDGTTAQLSVIYLIGFPTAFFLVAAYTESLFLALLLLAWRAASTEEWLQAGFWGAASVLVRFHGIALLLPMAYLIWKKGGLTRRRALALLAILLALFAWLLYARLGPVGAFPWQVQGLVWKEHIGLPWEGIIHNLFAISGQFPPHGGSLFSMSLDLFSALLFIILTIAASRVLPREHLLLMVVLLLIALTRVDQYGVMRSMSRYMLALFPGFLVLARAGRRTAFHWPWIIFSLTLEALASALFFLYFWVA